MFRLRVVPADRLNDPALLPPAPRSRVPARTSTVPPARLLRVAAIVGVPGRAGLRRGPAFEKVRGVEPTLNGMSAWKVKSPPARLFHAAPWETVMLPLVARVVVPALSMARARPRFAPLTARLPPA